MPRNFFHRRSAKIEDTRRRNKRKIREKRDKARREEKGKMWRSEFKRVSVGVTMKGRDKDGKAANEETDGNSFEEEPCVENERTAVSEVFTIHTHPA